MQLTVNQEVVLRTLRDHGPLNDVGIAYFVHHESPIDMSSSGARTRRSELTAAKLVTVVGTVPTKSGRRAAVHAVTPKGERLLEALDKVV